MLWGGSPQTFNFSGGTFTYSVNNVALINGGTVAVTGQITATAGTSTVPEPSSLALLGTGLVGLVPMIRRRRR